MAVPQTWQRLFKEARAALAEGRRADARRLAHEAARLAPQQEAPWLLLAATAEPKASIGYLEQALAINPNSARARKGMQWASQRLKEKSLPAPRGLSASLSLQRMSRTLRAAALLTMGFALFAWLRPPGADQGLRLVSAAAAQQVNALFSTATPTASNTPTPSATPTHTPTATPTHTPTDTPTSTPTPTATTVPTSTPVPVGLPSILGETNERWIDVNLSNQTLSAYEGETLVNSFVVSTGVARTPTVVGEFRIWVKVRIQDMSGPGYYIRDVPYVMYFYEDYGIHGTHWHNNFGTPMSAGCVNMTIDDSEWMYRFAEVGTIVKVHY
ncbi:MAG: hypothetical protein DWG76_05790 [Chloroflexi bacterium]|nr:hypothetical protein [Chloroflexota bacterium]